MSCVLTHATRTGEIGRVDGRVGVMRSACLGGRTLARLLAASSTLALAAVLAPSPAVAGFICLGNATGTLPPAASGGGASATGAGNVACGTNANANGIGSSNAAFGNGANARGALSANTASGTDADASGGGSRRSPMATSP